MSTAAKSTRLKKARSGRSGKKLFLFMMVSLDGYFEGQGHDLSWHNVNREFVKFTIEQTSSVGTILFGHKTFKLMESFWPTDKAKKDPITAALINLTPKMVFSHNLLKVYETEKWKNVRIYHKIIPEEINKLKKGNSKDMAIFGSNNLAVGLAEKNLIDEFRIMVNPVVLGKGTPLFYGIKKKLNLKLIKTREFKNGNVLLFYRPDKK